MTLTDAAAGTPGRVHAREAHDVTGAGDTMLATLARRLAEADNALRAMHRASIAAGLPCRSSAPRD